MYSGQSDVYKTMMRVRSQERQKRLSQARKAAENKRLLFDGLCISFVFFIFGAVIISIFMSINGAVK